MLRRLWSFSWGIRGNGFSGDDQHGHRPIGGKLTLCDVFQRLHFVSGAVLQYTAKYVFQLLVSGLE